MRSSSSLLRDTRVEPGAYLLGAPGTGSDPDAPQRIYSEAEVEAIRREVAENARRTVEAEIEAERTLERESLLRDLELLEGAAARLDRAEAEWIAGGAERVLQLALEIARRVVRTELETRPEMLLDGIRDLLARASRTRKRVLRLAPADLRRIQVVSQRSAHAMPSLEFEPDPSVAEGGYVLETETTSWNAELESAFESLEETLRDALMTRDEENAA